MLLYILLLIIIISAIFSYNKKIKEKFGGVNKPFTGWTADQYKALFYNDTPCGGDKQKFKGVGNNFANINPAKLNLIPSEYRDNFDWADGESDFIKAINKNTNNFYYNYLGKSIISPVKHQGACGSCYAFVTAGLIESCYYLSLFGFGEVKEFSIQQIIDCTSSDPTLVCNPDKPSKGCGGGRTLNIVRTYFTESKKIIFDKDYSYTSFYNTSKNPPGMYGDIQLTNYDFVKGNRDCSANLNNLNNNYYDNYIFLNPITLLIIDKEEYIKPAIFKYGPLAVSYYGSAYEDPNIKNYFPFQNYPDENYSVTQSDIYNGPVSFPGAANFTHVMIMTGWGIDNVTKTPYWIIKNSWGTDWGLNGYARFPMYKNIFNNIYAITFTRPLCETCNTMVSLEDTLIYVNKMKKLDIPYSAKILFNVYRMNPNNKIIFQIQTISPKDQKSKIAPMYNEDSLFGYTRLRNEDGVITSNDKYYYNKVDSKFVNSNNQEGLWFFGTLIIGGRNINTVPPITDDSYIWFLKLQVVDINKNILSEDKLELNWKNVFIV